MTPPNQSDWDIKNTLAGIEGCISMLGEPHEGTGYTIDVPRIQRGLEQLLASEKEKWVQETTASIESLLREGFVAGNPEYDWNDALMEAVGIINKAGSPNQKQL